MGVVYLVYLLCLAPSTDVINSDDLAKVIQASESFQTQKKKSRSKDKRNSLDLSSWVPLGAIHPQHINQAQGLSS